MLGFHAAASVSPAIQGGYPMNKKRSQLLTTFLFGVALSIAFGGGVLYFWKPSPCQPTFREISPYGIESEPGSPQFGIRATLIGCREDLDGISQQELKKMEDLVRELLKEQHWMLLSNSLDPEIRRDLTRKSNKMLGRSAVMDIYLHGFSAIE